MKLAYDTKAVQQFCHEHGVSRLELFGSALRADFSADSDVDLLATLRPEADAHCGLFEWVEMKGQLEHIFGRSVDLLSRKAVERSRNPYRKASILAHTEALYVEG